MLDEIKREWKRDKNFAIYITTWLFIVIIYSVLFVFISWHNWYLNTPERLVDPLNWIWAILIGITYLVMVIWGKKLK